MHYREFQPHPALLPYVENYWAMGAVSAQKELVVPDGNTSLMFLTAPVRRLDSDGRQALQLHNRAFVIGQKSRPVWYEFRSSRPILTFGVRFRPAGLSAFTRIPMAALTDQVVDAHELWGTLAGDTLEQIALATDQPAIAEAVNQLLLHHLKPQGQALAHHMIRLLYQRFGQYEAASWSRHFNLSERQIERVFQKHVGLSPKTFARVVRFNHTVCHHHRQRLPRLTDLAYAGGYFDQMHFVKEVKSFTGQTPKRYFQYSTGAWSQLLCALLDKRFGE